VAELMLVANPKRRRKHRKHARRRSNPHRRHARRRHNPRRRRATGYLVGSRRIRRRKMNPHRRHRRHHNPSFSLGSVKGMIKPVLKEGFIAATGAIALDAAWGYINPKLPATIASSPYLQFAVKCLVAIGVGVVGGKVLRGRARDLAVGGVTVAAHDMLKNVLQTSLPSVFGSGGTLALSGYGHMGAYLSGSAPVVGTATFPRAPAIPSTQFGAYLSGATGVSDGAGVYVDDCNGFDPWEG
jgi:hypothetical protein